MVTRRVLPRVSTTVGLECGWNRMSIRQFLEKTKNENNGFEAGIDVDMELGVENNIYRSHRREIFISTSDPHFSHFPAQISETWDWWCFFAWPSQRVVEKKPGCW